MRIQIVTLGCKLNYAESSALMQSLEAHGHTRCRQGESPDVVIVNTCTVTDTADHKDRQAIHRIRRENPNAKIILTGCYAELLRRKASSLVEKDAEILKEIDRLVSLLSESARRLQLLLHVLHNSYGARQIT